MSLVQHYKYVRIQKRSIKLKGRPAWQDVVPNTQQGRDAYAIAAKHESRFARAFLKTTRSILDVRGLKADFIRAYNSGSPAATEEVFPFFEAGSTSDDPVWQSFINSLMKAYSVVVLAAGKESTSEFNKKFKTNMRFRLETTEEKDAEETQTEVLKARPALRPLR